MPSLIERLFPIRETIVVAEPPQKAATGPGMFVLTGSVPMNTVSTDPNRLMAEAELLFHRNTWVAAAERAITSRFAGVPYHLEDENGETIEAKQSTAAKALIELLEKPSTKPKRNRRQLWGITSRHMGLPGNGFWYLDQATILGGIPLQTLYINPVRMTPATDEGGNLYGWIMDHPSNPLTPRGVTPVPFDLDELLHFRLDEPDYGHFGIGIAETAHAKIELSRLIDVHAATVIATGGRLAGIISPKAGGQPIGDEEWQAVIRDYRNITGDPESAKRVQVMKQPIDFTGTAMDIDELQLPALATASRDDILAAWGVPLSQLGIVPARGLNSGETPKYEEAQLWQGAIDARAKPFAEVLQTLIDRFAEVGLVAKLVLETPSFDDQAPLYENASKATTTPLTNNERRALVGLDPLEDEELGSQVWLITTMARIDGDEGGIVEEGPPPPAPVDEGPPDMPGEPGGPETAPTGAPAEGKAGFDSLRRRTEIAWEPRLRKTIAAVLSKQRDEAASRAKTNHAHLMKRPKDVSVVWNVAREEKRLREALEPIILKMARAVADGAAEKMRTGKALAADDLGDAGYQTAVESYLRERTGERITMITEARRDEIAKLVARGVDEGLGPLELSKLIAEDGLFGEYAAERIARTEMMFAYNDAALKTYQTLGAEKVEALDGDEDEECAARVARNPYTVEEAYGITDHPNGTLDWVPVVSEAAVLRAAGR